MANVGDSAGIVGGSVIGVGKGPSRSCVCACMSPTHACVCLYVCEYIGCSVWNIRVVVLLGSGSWCADARAFAGTQKLSCRHATFSVGL